MALLLGTKTRVLAAARARDWRPAADLLTRSYGDWPMRTAAVHALAEAAADTQFWRSGEDIRTGESAT